VRIFLDRLGNGAAANKLAVPGRFDQSGIRQDFEMVRDGGGGDSAKGDDFTTGRLPPRRDGPKDHQAGLIGKGFRDFHESRQLHGDWAGRQSAPLRICTGGRPTVLLPRRDATDYLDAHLSIESFTEKIK
jgi:hypothetical protein